MSGTPTNQNAHDTRIDREELRNFSKRSNAEALQLLLLLIIVIVATGSLISLTAGSLWLLPALFVHGIVLAHLFSLQHECEHHTAFRSRWMCDVVSTICGFIILVPTRYFRHEHMAHHRFTNLPGKDPELIDVPRSRLDYVTYILSVSYWRGLVSALFRNAFNQFNANEDSFIPARDKQRVRLEAVLFLAGYILVAVVSIVGDTTAVLWFWVLPLLLGQPVMRAIRMTEHVGRPQVKDRGQNTRTTLVSAPLRFLCWNMNYHAEHHFAPAVPFHALPALHERLKGALFVEPGGYLAAHRDIFKKVTTAEPL